MSDEGQHGKKGCAAAGRNKAKATRYSTQKRKERNKLRKLSRHLQSVGGQNDKASGKKFLELLSENAWASSHKVKGISHKELASLRERAWS